MLDLALHRDAEERDKVHDQDGPEYRHVEEIEERTNQTDERALRHRQPELELRQAANEWPELFVAASWQIGSLVLVILRIRIELRVDLGR
ncbi:hypothetical protein A7N06_19405 [Acinetobacter baumannii]|nr:hypothetical protein A7N06_19405 [Acinetobacter baumannii]